MPQFEFDATTHVAPPAPSREPLPRGMYQVIVMASDIKQTQAGTGSFIELTLQIIDGPYSGRRVWDRLNVSNPNKVAEDIGKRQLQELVLATGVKKMTVTEQLHDIPVLAEIDLDRKDPSRNRVAGYASLSSNLASQGARPVPAASPPSAAKPAARPWERK